MNLAQDKVGYYSRAWRTNNTKSEAERQRETENWKFVSGVNFGQWPTSALELLNQEGRPPTQFNFIQGKVLTLAGSFLQNPLETKYEADVGSPEWGADLMNKLLMYNKDSTSWSYAKSQFLLAMLTYRGILEIHKDYSRSPMGDVGLRYVNPFTVSFDYRWKTSNVDDCRRVYVAQMMDAEEIAVKFKKKNREITEAYERLKNLIDDPNDNTEAIDKIADRSPEYYDAIGNQYLVIQVLELQYKNKDRLFDIRSQEFLPDMDKEVMNALLNLGDNAKWLRVLPDETKELHVTTICPGLSRDLMLEDGPHPLQIGGYPFIVASALNLHGEAQGVVDIMKDPQVTINKREATMTHWQMTAANGVEFVEADAMEDEEFERYKLYKNKPGETFKVAPDTNKGEKVKSRDRGTPPNDLVESVNRAVGHMDRMWAPPSVQALEGKSGESGKLFEEKKEQALVALEFMNKTLAEVDHQIGEKFFRSSKIVYSGPARKMKLPRGEEMRLNWPMDDGLGVYNDVSQIPRLSIRITQSQAGVSIKRERLNLYSQYGQVITTPVMKAVLELMMVDVIPNLPEQDKEEIKAVQMEYIQLLRDRTQAERAQLAQAIQAANQSGVPGAVPGGPSAPGETPVEGGGISAEGKPIPVNGGLPADVRAQNQLS